MHRELNFNLPIIVRKNFHRTRDSREFYEGLTYQYLHLLGL